VVGNENSTVISAHHDAGIQPALGHQRKVNGHDYLERRGYGSAKLDHG
jgi:hypothetical protein